MLDLVDQVIGLQGGYSLSVVSHGLEKTEKTNEFSSFAKYREMNSSAGSSKVLTHTMLTDAELKSWSACILIHLDVPFEGKIDNKEK